MPWHRKTNHGISFLLNLFRRSLSAENCTFVFGKCSEKHHSKDSAGNHFTGAYSKHHKRDGKIDGISVTQYEWNQNCVGNNRRYRCKPFAAVAKLIGEYSSDKGSNASKCNIQRNCSAKQIGKDTAYEKAWDGSWCEKWKDGQGFGNPDLNLSIAKRCEHQCQYNIDSCNQRCLYKEQGTFVFHIHLSPLVLFYEWKVTNTRFI